MTRALFSLVALLLVSTGQAAETWTAQVVGITDGDTVKVLRDGHDQVKIRIAEIDTPERRQPWGNRAKQAMAALVHGQSVEVEPVTIDRYGRTIARLRVDGLDVGRELVRQGDAWVYRKYSKDPSLLVLEAEARAAGRGLWSLPAADQVPPWQWRRQRRSVR